MSRRKFNSIEQAAKASRLAIIELAVQRAAFKANGGTVESVGATRSHDFTIRQQTRLVMMKEQKQ